MPRFDLGAEAPDRRASRQRLDRDKAERLAKVEAGREVGRPAAFLVDAPAPLPDAGVREEPAAELPVRGTVRHGGSVCRRLCSG